MKPVFRLTLLLCICLSSVCWGQIKTSHATSNPPNALRMMNWLMDGSFSNPWDPYRIDNGYSFPVVITRVDLPPNFSMTAPDGQNNCTNLGPLTLPSDANCLLYLSYKPKHVSHTFEGWIVVHLTDQSGKPLPSYVNAVWGFGCPQSWSQFECLTFNAGW